MIIAVLALDHLHAGPARAGRAAPADRLEPARRDARGGLLDPRARRAPRRPAGRGAPRGQRAGRDAARAAPRRARGDGAALAASWPEIEVAVFAFDDKGRLRLVNRFGERLLGQPEPRLLGRSADELGLAAFLDATTRRTSWTRVPRRRGPLGGAAQLLPPGRRSSPAARAGRRQPAAARGGAAGVAAAHPRAGPRAQQLARADPVDRRQPAAPGRARRASARLARGPAPRPRRHRVARRGALPLHERLRAARAPAAAAAEPRRGGSARCAASRAWRRVCPWASSPALTRASRPTRISSSSS